MSIDSCERRAPAISAAGARRSAANAGNVMSRAEVRGSTQTRINYAVNFRVDKRVRAFDGPVYDISALRQKGQNVRWPYPRDRSVKDGTERRADGQTRRLKTPVRICNGGKRKYSNLEYFEEFTIFQSCIFSRSAVSRSRPVHLYSTRPVLYTRNRSRILIVRRVCRGAVSTTVRFYN